MWWLILPRNCPTFLLGDRWVWHHFRFVGCVKPLSLILLRPTWNTLIAERPTCPSDASHDRDVPNWNDKTTDRESFRVLQQSAVTHSWRIPDVPYWKTLVPGFGYDATLDSRWTAFSIHSYIFVYNLQSPVETKESSRKTSWY